MAKSKKYKCIKGWERNAVDDIVESYIFFRYPVEIRRLHFVEVNPTVNPTIKNPKVMKAPKPEVVIKPSVKTEKVVSTPIRSTEKSIQKTSTKKDEPKFDNKVAIKKNL